MSSEITPIPMEQILAMTHRLPVHRGTYIAALEYFNQGPGSVVDDRAAVAEWILKCVPQLRQVRRPQAVRLKSSSSYSDRDLAIWDAWTDVIKDLLGETLTVPPIPVERRDARPMTEKLIDRGVDPTKVWNVNPGQPNREVPDA